MDALATAAERLATWGVPPLPVVSRTKRPALAWKQLQERDPTPDERRACEGAWRSGRADRIALIHRNGWACLDLDAPDHGNPNAAPIPEGVLATLLAALRLPATYGWAGRSQGGRGLHLWLRCPDAPTAGAGVRTFAPRPEYAHVIGQIEARLHSCYTILPSRDGVVGYTGETLKAPPEERAWAEIAEALAATIALPPASAEPERPAGRVGRIDVDAAHRLLDQAFNAEALARWFGGELGVTPQQERSGEWRVPGQGGLLTADTPDGARWHCFSDGGGGGWVTAIARTRFGGKVPRGKGYLDLLRLAADVVGLALPEAPASPFWG